jgi:fatty-acyl-CoA synthase
VTNSSHPADPAPIPAKSSPSVSKAWLRALELTAPITRNPERTFPLVVEDLAARFGHRPALLSDRGTVTYSQLAARANQYARWTLAQGLRKGDVVCLLMGNRPEYIAIWLGITSVGCVVSLLNTNLVGASLAHCIQAVSPRHLITSSELASTLAGALPHLTPAPVIFIHGEPGPDIPSYPRIDLELQHLSAEPLTPSERRPPLIDDRALFIYTSGTTGLPKAANVSHARIMQWSHWFAGMVDAQPTDRMYNCLPMYHSVGGVVVPCATLTAGGSVVIREKFSASQFWNDIVRWKCTAFQYIGELCRYLLDAPPSPLENTHQLRLACGNGIASEVWEQFQTRFRIPQILEFYASTEGGVSLFNVQGKPGAIGHIPSYLSHRFAPALVAFDVESGQPVRDEQGFCIRCAVNQPGEALAKMQSDPASRFEGYTSAADSEMRILRNVFAPGDAWVRTGDLMRKDEKGFFYFVDRIGDTFRWKGENVATSEVAKELAAFPGIRHANVYGVTIPGAEGRTGMAAIVVDPGLNLALDLAALRAHLAARLPAYARPLFLRIQPEIEITGTFKYSKADLVRQGFDPAACLDGDSPAVQPDQLYFDSPEAKAFVPLDSALYDRICSGSIRL